MADPDGDVEMYDQQYDYDDEFADEETPVNGDAEEFEASDDGSAFEGEGPDGMTADQESEDDESDSGDETEDDDMEARYGYDRLVAHMDGRRTSSAIDDNIDPNLEASTADYADEIDPEVIEAINADMADVTATMRTGWRKKDVRQMKAAERQAMMDQLYGDADSTKPNTRGRVLLQKYPDGQDPLDYTRHLPDGTKKNSIEAARLGAYNLIPEHEDIVFPNGKRLTPSMGTRSRRRSSLASQTAPVAATDPQFTDAVEQWNKSMSFWSTQPSGGLGFNKESDQLDPEEPVSDDEDEVQGAPMRNAFSVGPDDRVSPSPPDDESETEFEAEDDHGLNDLVDTPAHPYFVDQALESDQDGESGRALRGRGSRGRARARGGRKDSSAPKRGRGGWRQLIAGTEHDPKVRKREEQKADRKRRKEIAKRNGVPLKRGRVRKEHQPSRECKGLMGQAAEALMEGELETALQCAQAAVATDSEAFDAHSLLSDVLVKLGRQEDALAALHHGADLTNLRIVEKWLDIAQRTIDLAIGAQPTTDQLKQALWAYSRAWKCCNYSTDAELKYATLVGKRDVHAALGNVRDAKRVAYKVFVIRPEVMDNARVYAELCVRTGYDEDVADAVKSYETAFHQHKGKDTFADTVEEMWSHVNIFVELLDRMGPNSSMKGTYWLKLLARWILGRKDEAFWDLLQDDDREFDIENDRRAYVPDFQQGRASMDKSKYGSGLPLDLRVRLGLFRIKMGYPHHEEAIRHLDFLLLLSDDVAEYYDLFLNAANTCMHYSKWEQALKFFNAINEGVEVTEHLFFMNMARCHIGLSQYANAEEIYKRLILDRDENFLARAALVNMYKTSGQNEKALAMAKDIRRKNHNRLDNLARLGILPEGKKQPRPRTVLGKQPTRPLEPSVNASVPDNYDDFWENMENRRTGANRSGLQPLLPKPLAPKPSNTQPAIQPKQSRRTSGKRSGLQPDTESSAQAERQQRTAAPSASQLEETSPVPTIPGPRKARRLYDPTYTAVDKVQARLQRIARDADAVQDNFAIVRELWPALEEEDGDEEAVEQWMEAATELVNTFRRMDVFYPQGSRLRKFGGYTSVRGRGDWGKRKKGKPEHVLTDDIQKEAQRTIDKLQPKGQEDEDLDMTAAMPEPGFETPLNFHGISFAEWHHVFVDLALLHAKRADQEACYDLLKGGMFYCNVFIYDWELHRITISAALLCALTFNDTDLVGDMARHFVNKSDYRSGFAYQLMATSVRLCYGQWSTQGATQKFLHRMMKIADYTLLPPSARAKINYEQKASILENRVQRIGEGVGELDAGIIMLYASMLYYGVTRNSNPLAYYLRALAIEPDNYSIHLAIGITYIHHAMKRITDNRQTQIQQGMSFLYRYRDLRTASGKASHVQEAEYNLARAHHMIGLTHLAIPAYERVLQYSQAVKEEKEAEGGEAGEAEDLGMEAAYALQQILALTGNQVGAIGVTEEYLVL